MPSRSRSASSLNLTQKDVDNLVLEYLAAKGFAETESVLKKELKGSSKKGSSPVQGESSTRLEDLLEKSFVTEYKYYQAISAYDARVGASLRRQAICKHSCAGFKFDAELIGFWYLSCPHKPQLLVDYE